MVLPLYPPFFWTRPQRHTKTGLDVGIHGIPSRLFNSLVYANNMLIWMFMVVSLLYRHLTTGSFNITEKNKTKKHSAKDVSLQKSKKKTRIPSLRDAVPERLLLFTEQPPSVWAKFTIFGAGILGAKTSEKTAPVSHNHQNQKTISPV
jgi:hypothetical protein